MNYQVLVVILIVTTGVYAEPQREIYPRLPNYVENSDNALCNFHSSLYRDHLENFTYWAHEMLDSSAKTPVGVIRGSTFQPGNFRQCLSIDAPFTTKYCTATLSAIVPAPNPPRNPFSLHYDRYKSILDRIYSGIDESQIRRDSIEVGLCIPESCAAKDLETSLRSHVAKLNFPEISYNLTVLERHCTTKYNDQKSFDGVDTSFCLLTLLLILLVIVSSVFDFSKDTDEKLTKNKMVKVVQAFSITKNYKNLTHYCNSNPCMDILNGMRGFSMFVIIIVHRFAFSIGGPLTNYDHIEREFRNAVQSILFHADLFVDSFFMFSGILVAYLMLLNNTNRPFLIVLTRYLRLTPSYAFVIFYYASMFYYIGSGPFWNSIILGEVKDCRTNWWTNLLYINNYVNVDHSCIGQTWYLPCDFHYFIIGLLAVMTIKKNKKVGLIFLGSLVVISIVIPFIQTFVQNLPPMLFFFKKFMEAPKQYSFFRIYVMSHMRATSYLIGLVAGYVYFRLKENPIKMSKKASYSLTIGSIMTIFLSLLSGSIYYNRVGQYSALEAGAFAALHRLPWTIGTAVFMITTSYGQISFIRNVLSWKGWVPIAKLSYAAYLLHMQFPLRTRASVVVMKEYNFFDVLHQGLGDVVMTLIFSFLLYMGIEAPVQNIYKMLLQPKKKKPAHEKENEDSKL